MFDAVLFCEPPTSNQLKRFSLLLRPSLRWSSRKFNWPESCRQRRPMNSKRQSKTSNWRSESYRTTSPTRRPPTNHSVSEGKWTKGLKGKGEKRGREWKGETSPIFFLSFSFPVNLPFYFSHQPSLLFFPLTFYAFQKVFWESSRTNSVLLWESYLTTFNKLGASQLHHLSWPIRPLRNDVMPHTRTPFRPLLDQTLCEHSGGLFGSNAKISKV